MAEAKHPIRSWAVAQLPPIPLPDDATLDLLSAGQAAHDLWQFLTTRVRSIPNARRAQAIAVLAEEAETADDCEVDEDLEAARAEVALAEGEVARLRAELEAEDGGVWGTGDDGLTEAEARDGLEDVLCSITDAKESEVDAAQNALDAMLRSETDCLDHDNMGAALPENVLPEILQEFSNLLVPSDSGIDSLPSGNFDALDNELRTACETLPLSKISSTLLNDVRRSAHTLRSSIALLDPPTASAPAALKAKELAARDALLQAYKPYDDVVRESRRAEAGMVEESRRLRESDADGAETLLACAQLHGEQATLAFAAAAGRPFVDVAEGEGARLKAEVRRRNEKLERLDEATAVLRMGNRQLWAEAEERWEELRSKGKRVSEMTAEAAEEVERVAKEVGEVRRKVREEGITCGDRGHAESDDEVVTCAERAARRATVELVRKETEKWEKRNKQMINGLKMRSEVAAEARERMLDLVGERILPQLERALEDAERCRDDEVVRVREELRNWVREPGAEVARELGLVDTAGREEGGTKG